jgi:selenocysteine-specific elongation factor
MPCNVTRTETHRPDRTAAARRHLILGTAGHIDHGKTSLVKALTGVDTDRLPEEQARGMTIELGFAGLDLGDIHLGVVDVPGHEKFVRTMVAGATGIDLVMLLVAADDSVMPQTREHVDILQLLGVRHGVVAVSKCDLVDDDMAGLVTDEVRALLADTSLAGAAIVRVSAHTGAGLEELKNALREQAQAVPERAESAIFRLAIDRVFTIHGRGTVVTGSATSGRVSVGASLELLPRRLPCKVRGLQSHHDQADSLGLGERVALNLSGLERTDVERGDELATPGSLTPGRAIDVHLQALAANPRPLRSQLIVRLCMGTAEHRVRLKLLEPGPLPPGARSFARLLSPVPLAAAWGQRYIVRDDANARTLGGGVVLRPLTRRGRVAQADDLQGLATLLSGGERDRLAEVLRFEAVPEPTEVQLACMSGADVRRIPGLLATLRAEGAILKLGERGPWVAAARLRACREQTLSWLRRHHGRHVNEPGCPSDALQGWMKRRWGPAVAEHLFENLRSTDLRIFGRYCALAEFAPQLSADEERLLAWLVETIGAAGCQPPAAAELGASRGLAAAKLKKLVKIAVATGQLVQINPEIMLHQQTFERMKILLAEKMAGSDGVTVAEIRNLIDSSRKFVVPIVEHLDRIGFTRRIGDKRVLAGAGEPRAASSEAEGPDHG